MNLNFICGGQVGDLIHALYVIKNICEKENKKANLYITVGPHGSGEFTFDLEKTYADLYSLIYWQPYIDKFEVLRSEFNEEFINLNNWRDAYADNFKTWSELLSEHYKFEIPSEYKWLTVLNTYEDTKGKVLIHRSNKRHGELNWPKILSEVQEDILFITSSQSEYDSFGCKGGRVQPYIVQTIGEMASAINNCKLFIGNQSLPFAIASSLDVPRICELHESSQEFYSGEHRYSDNISWFLNPGTHHTSKNSSIIF